MRPREQLSPYLNVIQEEYYRLKPIVPDYEKIVSLPMMEVKKVVWSII